MKKIIHNIQNLKLVFYNWKYITLSVIVAILFYTFNVFISNYKIVFFSMTSYSFLDNFRFYFNLIMGYGNTMILSSFVTLIIISVLFGVLVSLITFKIRMIKSFENHKLGVFASVGILLGILAPGCAACGLGLLPLLGLSATSLYFLPFKGLEISIIAILILGFAIFQISRNITECKITSRKVK